MADKVTWLSYDFLVYEQSGGWNDIAGVYIFAGLNQQGLWFPLYVGRTDSFVNRIPNHERWLEAISIGASHVHAMAESLEANRVRIENHLIQAYQPPLNVQLK